ncbi:MAG: type II secretion system F family protein [Anaerolineae bacterium]|nr:type II secretion system F family protein [Anaerolineae bacterium]
MTVPPTVLIAFGAGLFAVVLLVIGLISLRGEREQTVEERLGRYTSEFQYSVTLPEGDEDEVAPSILTQRLDKALAGRAFAENWRVQLARANLKLTVAEYFAAHIIAVIVFFFAAFFLFRDSPAIWPVAAIIGFFAPRIYVNRRQQQRLHGFEGQLADVLGLWVNSLRSGYSVLQAMEAIAREAPDPAALEFRRVVQEVQLGISMEDALDNMLRRIDSEDFDLVITAVNIQREVGGNLAEILEVIAHTIRERIKLKGEIRVLTTQGRYTGYLIGGLPIVLSLFLYAINPGYMGRMFENRACGWPMVGCGLGLIATGAAIIRRIVDIEV